MNAYINLAILGFLLGAFLTIVFEVYNHYQDKKYFCDDTTFLFLNSPEYNEKVQRAILRRTRCQSAITNVAIVALVLLWYLKD